MRYRSFLLLLSLGLTGLAPLPAQWYTEAGYADSPAGDYVDGEDPEVRAVAIEALGRLNGSVVVLDAETGRALTIVNQKLALADGYIPCSTVKLITSVAALSERVVESQEKVYFPEGWYMTIPEGLAISNNVIFDHLGEKLGFARVRRYARLFGFGERAGWGIPGEQLGVFPDQEHEMGVGRMTSFGSGIFATPLQMAAFTAAIANGGKLFYIQHPTSREALTDFEPKLKRDLPIAPLLPDVEEGMLEAVKRGTGRRANVPGQTIRGKTGTCSLYLSRRSRTRMGWFTSFWRSEDGRPLAVTVMLRGGSGVTGPLAAEVAGKVYRGLLEGDLMSRLGGPADSD